MEDESLISGARVTASSSRVDESPGHVVEHPQHRAIQESHAGERGRSAAGQPLGKLQCLLERRDRARRLISDVLAILSVNRGGHSNLLRGPNRRGIAVGARGKQREPMLAWSESSSPVFEGEN